MVKIFLVTFAALAIFVVVFGVSTVARGIPNEVRDGPKPGEPVFCTMDAKICPDGSAVGRVGPNCEFAPCPGATSTATTTVR